mgnify:CR=1 FL=1
MLDSSDFLFVNHHGSIAEALLHRSLIALREEIHEPSSDILGGRIEIKHLVEIGVIHLAMHRFLDMDKSITMPSWFNSLPTKKSSICQL